MESLSHLNSVLMIHSNKGIMFTVKNRNVVLNLFLIYPRETSAVSHGDLTDLICLSKSSTIKCELV